MYECSELDDLGKPPPSQYFRLTVFKNINYGNQEYCLDTFKLHLPECHYEKVGNQIWFYDRHEKIIVNTNEFGEVFCLTGNFTSQEIYLKKCQEDDEDQKWEFTKENKKLLDRWDEVYGYDKLVYRNGVFSKEKMEPVKDSRFWKCE